MHKITYALTRGEQTVTLDVEYDVANYYPASGPSWDSPGEPAAGGEITELRILFEGHPFLPTAAETNAIEQHIYQTHDYSDDGYDPEGDYLADRSLD